MPMNLRPVALQATPQEPEPINGSNTVWPSLVYVLIKYISNGTGFCVELMRLVLGCGLNLKMSHGKRLPSVLLLATRGAVP